MKLKPTRVLYSEQLRGVILRKSRNSKYSGILPVVVKKLGLSLILLLIIPRALVEAQVTPDESLSTNVEQQGENRLNINGGEKEGNNLFHSFESFSVPEGIEAIFENAPDIENIFTRITGESASSINGILSTQGGANFFLVNPNGIIFGENAQLDVGGSFIATTANSIQFEDGTEFTASDAESEPILTVSVPIGLQFDGDSGPITVDGTGNQITNGSTLSPIEIGQTSSNFSISSNQTLALVGNGIDLNGSVISTEGGQIYLTSVSSGLVGIKRTVSGLSLSDNNLIKYQDINLNQQSLISAIGEKAGIIFLSGKNINLLNASFILAQNQGNLSGSSLNIKASEFLTLSGKSPNNEISSAIRSEVLQTGEAQGANIIISAQKLQLRDQGQIQTGSFSESVNGLGGDININVSDTVDLNSGLISASAFSEASAGNIELSTSQLQVNNAASLTSSTTGSGNGGNIKVNADFIKLAGSFNDVRSTISASSLGTGDAGSLTIITKQLRVEEGASFSSSSFGNGNAGNISIDASELITLDGKNSNFQSNNEPQGTTIRTSVQSIDPVAQQIFGLPEVPTGNSGNLTINTPILNLAQDSVISVENQGTGNGGTLSINAEQLNLEQVGKVTAATASGQGGNINLKTENLQIDEGSEITATAENNGDGGNVTINTTSLIAKKNSQVTANAFGGRGGNINIDAEGLFLFDSPENIFSASSELGIDGEIQINTPDINFQKELEQSELEILTAEQAISTSCLARSNQQASFTVGSNGGLPKNSDSNYSDANFSLTGVGSLPIIPEKAALTQKNQALIPAEKMVETEDGRIFLVASPKKAKSLFCPKN